MKTEKYVIEIEYNKPNECYHALRVHCSTPNGVAIPGGGYAGYSLKGGLNQIKAAILKREAEKSV